MPSSTEKEAIGDEPAFTCGCPPRLRRRWPTAWLWSWARRRRASRQVPRDPATSGATSPQVPPRSGDADVQDSGAALDHVGGDESGNSGGGDHDVGRRDVAGQIAVPVWHRVTVAFSERRVSSRPSGRPTVTLGQRSRPQHQRKASYRRNNSTMPRGVCKATGQVSPEPADRVRRVQTVRVLGRIHRLGTAFESGPFGSGSCTM